MQIAMMLSPRSFREGRNTLRLYLVTGDNTLTPLRS
jgi:hypothetical protein